MGRNFTVASGTTLTIQVTADNAYALYLDGVQVSSGVDWTLPQTVSVPVSAGAREFRLDVSDAGAPTAVLLSARDSSGTVVVRTGSNGWTTCASGC